MALPSETEVMIVGAGPTGLSLAMSLAKQIPFLLIDRLAAAVETSRAAAVHARTLEVLEAIGVAEEMVAAGQAIPSIVLQDPDQTLLQGRVQRAADPLQLHPGVAAEPDRGYSDASAGSAGRAHRPRSGAVAVAQDGAGVDDDAARSGWLNGAGARPLRGRRRRLSQHGAAGSGIAFAPAPTRKRSSWPTSTWTGRSPR